MPEDQRELARFGLARNRTFKNVFDKREQRELARYAEWRTDERSKSRDQACLCYALQGGRRLGQNV